MKSAARITFDVELRGQHRLQGAHIATSDMSLIRSWMHRDALGPEAFDIQCHAHHIRVVAATRIAQRGEFVDIDTEPCHVRSFTLFHPTGAQK